MPGPPLSGDHPGGHRCALTSGGTSELPAEAGPKPSPHEELVGLEEFKVVSLKWYQFSAISETVKGGHHFAPHTPVTQAVWIVASAGNTLGRCG